MGSILDFSQFSDNVEKDALNRIASGVYQSLLSIEGIKTVKEHLQDNLFHSQRLDWKL